MPLCALLLFIHLFICCLFLLFKFSLFYPICFPFLSCFLCLWPLLRTSILNFCIFLTFYFLVDIFQISLFLYVCPFYLSFFVIKMFPFLFLFSCVFEHDPFLFSFLNICFSFVSSFLLSFFNSSWCEDSLRFDYPFSSLFIFSIWIFHFSRKTWFFEFFPFLLSSFFFLKKRNGVAHLFLFFIFQREKYSFVFSLFVFSRFFHLFSPLLNFFFLGHSLSHCFVFLYLSLLNLFLYSCKSLQNSLFLFSFSTKKLSFVCILFLGWKLLTFICAMFCLFSVSWKMVSCVLFFLNYPLWCSFSLFF